MGTAGFLLALLTFELIDAIQQGGTPSYGLWFWLPFGLMAVFAGLVLSLQRWGQMSAAATDEAENVVADADLDDAKAP